MYDCFDDHFCRGSDVGCQEFRIERDVRSNSSVISTAGVKDAMKPKGLKSSSQ
jgi:hypothetical protein